MYCLTDSICRIRIKCWYFRHILSIKAVQLYFTVKQIHKHHQWVVFLLTASPSCQAHLGSAGCRQTLWEICTALLSRPVWLPRLTTDQPAAWSTSARLSAESTTPCSMTSFIVSGSSIAHSRYMTTRSGHLRLSVVCFGWIANGYLYFLWQNVPLQDTNRSLGFLGWGWGWWLNLKHISSACASHSQHLSAGDIQHLELFTYSVLPFLLLHPGSSCRSTKTRCPSPPYGSLYDEGCSERQKRCRAWWNNRVLAPCVSGACRRAL